ncbi:MAG TPA: hypothetical protein DDW51_05625 [Cyanobacteria bacterium UBA11367]|nr:hypothetical protein [Cyanobacteria bacterium UBA11367]
MNLTQITLPPVRSIARPTPTVPGFCWDETNSSDEIIERWRWNGSLYLSDRKTWNINSTGGSLPTVVSSAVSWYLPIVGGVRLEVLDWTPTLGQTSDANNFWQLEIKEYQEMTLSGGGQISPYATQLQATNQSISPRTKWLQMALNFGNPSLPRICNLTSRVVAVTVMPIGTAGSILVGGISITYRNWKS